MGRDSYWASTFLGCLLGFKSAVGQELLGHIVELEPELELRSMQSKVYAE